MFNLTNMNSIKQYAASANKSVSFATFYVMNVYHNYPELYDFAMSRVNNKTMDIVMGAVCWVLLCMLLRSMLRLCMDPFSVKLHTKITELENKLSEEEDSYSELYDENCEQAEKIVKLTKKLEDAEKALAEIKAQYLCCRKAAKAFLDSTADADTKG